jgi:hypothetical protein
MRTKTILSMILLTAVSITFGLNEAKAAVSVQVGTPNASFSINDYQPAPPNVYVQNDRGRPYYVERDRRVYMEKRKPGKHYKKEKKHHEDHGREEGHEKHNGHER